LTRPTFEGRGLEKRRLDLAAQELDRELAAYGARDTAMQQRATVLIGAASITGALQVTAVVPLWIHVTSLCLSLLAAVAGVVVVFPHTGDALDVRTMRDAMKKTSFIRGYRKLIDVKLEILEADEKWLTTRGRFARLGFIALTVSIALAAAAAVTQAGTPIPSSPPSPTVSPAD
jgi:hypothetical protein